MKRAAVVIVAVPEHRRNPDEALGPRQAAAFLRERGYEVRPVETARRFGARPTMRYIVLKNGYLEPGRRYTTSGEALADLLQQFGKRLRP